MHGGYPITPEDVHGEDKLYGPTGIFGKSMQHS